MRADPEPQDLVPLSCSYSPVPQADANGKDGADGMNLLELETGMPRVPEE